MRTRPRRNVPAATMIARAREIESLAQSDARDAAVAHDEFLDHALDEIESVGRLEKLFPRLLVGEAVA